MNKNYFDCWSQEMSYILGFIFADGSITKNGMSDRMSIGLCTDDEKTLRWIGNCLDYQNKFYIHKKMIILTISSKYLVDSLKNLGVVHRKSFLDPDFPKIPIEYKASFLRGYFDGDGSIFKTGQGYYKITVVGSPKFLQGYANACSELANIKNIKIAPCQISIAYMYNLGDMSDIKSFAEKIYMQTGPTPMIRKLNVIKDAYQHCQKKLIKKGIGKHNGKWRVRIAGKHVGHFNSFEAAVEAKEKFLI